MQLLLRGPDSYSGGTVPTRHASLRWTRWFANNPSGAQSPASQRDSRRLVIRMCWLGPSNNVRTRHQPELTPLNVGREVVDLHDSAAGSVFGEPHAPP